METNTPYKYEAGEPVVLIRNSGEGNLFDIVDYVTPSGQVRLEDHPYSLYKTGEDILGRPIWFGSGIWYILPLAKASEYFGDKDPEIVNPERIDHLIAEKLRERDAKFGQLENNS